jgi:antibiotic biosynthesis monooxygenase (ABM) superfamily enzyme
MEPVHVAITRLVQPGKEAAFEKAMYAFIERSIGVHGVTGVHLLRPAPGADSREYGILRSFESREARDAFYSSDLFAAWEEEVAPLVESGCSKRELHGLEAFFRRGAIGAPPRWKMALLTWMGVFPSVVVWSAILRPPLHALPVFATTAVITGFVVLTLAWGVMPVLTKAFAGWLRAGTAPPVNAN